MNEFSRNLKKLRNYRNITMDELVNDLNKKYNQKFNKSMISKWENGKEASLTSAKILADYFNVSLDYLIGIQQSDEIVRENTTQYNVVDNLLPVLGDIAAGEPIFSEQNIIGYAPAPPDVNPENRELFYLKVKGDSMNREFEDGSYVCVDKNLSIENGEIAAVRVNNNEATVKKLNWNDKYLTLIPLSHNDDFYPQVVDLEKQEVSIIGKVIGAFKKY